jgi:hypothetical protein
MVEYKVPTHALGAQLKCWNLSVFKQMKCSIVSMSAMGGFYYRFQHAAAGRMAMKLYRRFAAKAAGHERQVTGSPVRSNQNVVVAAGDGF